MNDFLKLNLLEPEKQNKSIVSRDNFSELFNMKRWQEDANTFDYGSGLSTTAFDTSNMMPDVASSPGWQDMTWAERLFGGQRGDFKFGGAAMPALQLANSGLNAYIGLKQLGQAEDSLKFQKDAFSKQFAAQQKLTNSQLADRQAARVAFNSNKESVDDYMKKYGV